MKVLSIVACLLFATPLFAQQNCVTNARGKVVCSGANTAAAANANTGRAAVAQKNSNGVTTTQTNTGGKSKTKNGMGVAKGAGGTDCAKGKNHSGCVSAPPK